MNKTNLTDRKPNTGIGIFNFLILIPVCFLGLFASGCTNDESLPYQNSQLSAEERAKDLIGRLTLEEKAALMCDQSDAIPRLGIKKFNWWSEALHGLA